MGCCGKDFETGNCVCDILKEIADAQNDVVENCCDTSCERSISDLLGDTDNGNGLDTVPVLLYCKGDCEPFKGFGVHPDDMGNVVSSFFFRVKRVDDDCCATLELLRSEEEHHHHHHHHDHDNEGEWDRRGNCCDPECPADQDTENLRTTGICITANLDCFCIVTCLPAINAFN
ncbi:spore coat protein [Virgibacillus phasianinus]|uniref:Spore coat protein n=1 Tax=Virgibacillus phasianinus TaxID=2017483 RepID=A0A220TYJ7_9BACI|nr:CotY/CotZ family spore coat protein [Virgibacillus phasianinus]ASK60786.1 spore coat protein [Virgibacillus phasianinus]